MLARVYMFYLQISSARACCGMISTIIAYISNFTALSANVCVVRVKAQKLLRAIATNVFCLN